MLTSECPSFMQTDRAPHAASGGSTLNLISRKSVLSSYFTSDSWTGISLSLDFLSVHDFISIESSYHLKISVLCWSKCKWRLVK